MASTYAWGHGAPCGRDTGIGTQECDVAHDLVAFRIRETEWCQPLFGPALSASTHTSVSG